MAGVALKRVEIQATSRLRALMREYFLDLDAAAKDPSRRVAWCTSVGPCEILAAFGFAVYFPENHGALLGARKMSHEIIPRAAGLGYCAEACSYMNSDIGCDLTDRSPLKELYGIDGPPRPDVLVYSTNQCRDVQEWFNYFGQRHNAMVMGIRPPRHLGDVTREHIADVRAQLEHLIDRLEIRFEQKLDRKRLREAVERSSRVSMLWGRVLDTAQHRPSPLTFWDMLIHMAPVILMRGSHEAIEYYETLLAEMEQRIAEGVAAVPDEQWRIYWEGMPVWPRLRELSEKFFDLRTAVVASTYCNSWAFEPYTGGDPLDWMARTSIQIFINRDEVCKERFLESTFDRFSVDGAIFHNARTCPNNTNSRYGMPERMRQRLDLPVLVLDGDLSDIRFFSTAQSMTNIEAFAEQLEGRK